MMKITSSDWQPAPKPVNSRLIAIGDVHGCAHLLRTLRDHIATLPGHRRVYLGDLIDPHLKTIAKTDSGMSHDCADVIDQVAEDQTIGGTDVLAGNHDAFFLIARKAGYDRANVPWQDGIWYDQGGRETAAAWGFGYSTMGKPHEGALARELDARMTSAQRGVFDTMKIWVDHDDYLLVHAGFDPRTPIDKQKARASILDFPNFMNEQSHLLWMRFNPSTDAAPKGRVLVHGHTPARAAILRKKRICIDTGAKYGGPLTALELDGDRMRLHQAWPDGMDAATWKKDGLR